MCAKIAQGFRFKQEQFSVNILFQLILCISYMAYTRQVLFVVSGFVISGLADIWRVITMFVFAFAQLKSMLCLVAHDLIQSMDWVAQFVVSSAPHCPVRRLRSLKAVVVLVAQHEVVDRNLHRGPCRKCLSRTSSTIRLH